MTDIVCKCGTSRLEDIQCAVCGDYFKAGWIPVSEGLPEMYSPVLTMAKKAKYPRILSREKEDKDVWVWSLRQLSGYVAYIDQKSVTHWMPLPPPPQEAE